MRTKDRFINYCRESVNIEDYRITDIHYMIRFYVDSSVPDRAKEVEKLSSILGALPYKIRIVKGYYNNTLKIFWNNEETETRMDRTGEERIAALSCKSC